MTAAPKVNLFLCAAPRSGSTQLASWLDTHPDISCLPIKEPNFFASQDFDPEYVSQKRLNDIDPNTYVRSKSKKFFQFAIFREQKLYDYLSSNLSTPWRLDASTTYLQSQDAPERIYNYNQDAVIVILMRHPLERALSHYRLARRTGRTRRTLKEQINAELGAADKPHAQFLLRLSCYEAALDRYQSIFPSENIVQLRFEDVFSNPIAALNQLGERLRIDLTSIILEKEARNQGDAPLFPTLTSWATESGLKHAIARTITPNMKNGLKRMLFRKARYDDIDRVDRDRLAVLLADSIRFYERMA